VTIPPEACTGQWGCNCGACGARQHPMDLMARITSEEKGQIAARSLAVSRLARDGRACASCDRTDTRLYATYPRLCPDHAPAGTR